MSNQEIEKQTFHNYLTAIFQSENLTVETCNGDEGFDFKVAPGTSLAAFRKSSSILERPLFDFDNAQLEKQLQELMRKSELETSSALPVSSSSVSNTSNVGGKRSSSSSVGLSSLAQGKGNSSNSVNPVLSVITAGKTAGKQTGIGSGSGKVSLKTRPKPSSFTPSTSSTTSSTKSRNSTNNSSNSPYIEIKKIDNSSMENLITYLRKRPKRGVLTDYLVEKVIPNIIEYRQQLSGIDRSKVTEKQRGILALFRQWKQELVNTLGQYINTLFNDKRQRTDMQRTANEIRNIIYKGQYKTQPK